VSKLNRSLVLENLQEQNIALEELFPGRHLSISSVEVEEQMITEIVKISGSITVSF
jgi:hypothetical protein